MIAIDVSKHPQKMMPIMNIVWPLTGLYFPIVGMWAYYKLGRSNGNMKIEHNSDQTGHMGHHDHDYMHNNHKNMSHPKHMNHDSHEHMEHHEHGDKPFWQSVFVSTTHCSSGCSLGDMIGVPIVALTGLTIAGSTLFADYAVEFVLAYIFGIAFQYYGMGFKKQKEPGKAIKNAIKADTWSLIAFEIGMFGWMALVHYVFFIQMPEPTTAVFWFMMQIAMMLGFLTSYPANWILVKKGIKHAM
ncbi:DUF4396 domain-containing protein [Virgibacillus sp. 179-BFC.A HS]|uniref:DUF4396 domain-containing protein n=1 Tax=Tigheibacillus jepli TaxID=3035914 RepID=A0ABU5CLG6_9BACI|nr:DUF4396 domain-containing protein [Virgibacillus sp. 179-BFC.A HS]MDY0407184.1 DUF4396 domain-containing protein [Virgibacillus sp. 179-BFC.A HS]